MPSLYNYSFAEIEEGLVVEREYQLDASVYDAFLNAFADHSPLHVDDAYARASGFQGRVMHGAILNGFLSHFIGMHFPGRRALWLSVDLRYLKPSYLNDRLRLLARVIQKVESQRILVINITFHNQTQNLTAARGRIQVAVRDE